MDGCVENSGSMRLLTLRHLRSRVIGHEMLPPTLPKWSGIVVRSRARSLGERLRVLSGSAEAAVHASSESVQFASLDERECCTARRPEPRTRARKREVLCQATEQRAEGNLARRPAYR